MQDQDREVRCEAVHLIAADHLTRRPAARAPGLERRHSVSALWPTLLSVTLAGKDRGSTRAVWEQWVSEAEHGNR